MSRRPSSQMPPSSPNPRPAQPSLTVRTSIHPSAYSPVPSTQQALSASPPDQSSPEEVPKPIPAEKLEKALQLYIEYERARMEEELNARQLEPQSATRVHDGYHLRVPTTPAPRSVTSHGSSRRRRATSVSTSGYEVVTDLSSVMSFEENESPSSAKARQQSEFVAFDGKPVKQRVRKKLQPKAKAKAALVRWLGSCKTCHRRRVPCPLDHHDIESLERSLRLREAARSRGNDSPYQQSSHSRSNSQQNNVSTPTNQTMASFSQRDELLGLGQNEELLQTSGAFDTSNLDIQSPGGALDPLAGISAPYQTNSDMSYPSPIIITNAYSDYQDGQMFPIGVLRGNFFCQHRDGTCLEYFEDPEALQVHFEREHFAFTRIDPAVRLMCPSCQQMNTLPQGPCCNCGIYGAMEVWIYGNFIRNSSYPRYPPDRQDLHLNTPTSTPYYSSSYDPPSFTSPEDPSMDNGSFYESQGNFNFQMDNTYAGSDIGSQGDYGFGSFNSAGPSNQYQGYTRAHHNLAKCYYSVRSSCANSRLYQHRKWIMLSALLFFAVMFGFTYDWAFSIARTVLTKAIAGFRSHLPAIGFISILASFAMSSSVKHIGTRRVRDGECPIPKYSFARISSFPFKCRHTAPDTPLLGGGLS